MFVFTPQIACALTQSLPERSRPYFSSNHRTKRPVLNPVESGANTVSMARNGKLLWTINCCRIGVSSWLSRNVFTIIG